MSRLPHGRSRSFGKYHKLPLEDHVPPILFLPALALLAILGSILTLVLPPVWRRWLW